MIARLRSNWFAIRASYWFWPALFALAGFALAMILIRLDAGGRTAWFERLRLFDLAEPGTATNLLNIIAASMIGVASTVFSITIAAVAYVSGTFGPRLLTNFMEDKGNQLSLATFIGTFVYALVVLRSVGSAFVPQLALLVAFALMLVSVAVLVYFLHHIPASIRITAVLESVGERLLDRVRNEFPLQCPSHAVTLPEGPAQTICARETGYIRVIDHELLAELADRHDADVVLRARAGDFVHPGVPVAAVHAASVPPELADGIHRSIAVGGTRALDQDIDFAIDELVEIALRALSPAINDPFTAINAMHWLGAVMAELGQRDLIHPIDFGEAGGARVFPMNDGFDHFVRRGFGAARSGLATSRIAAMVSLDTIGQTARSIEAPDRRAVLLAEADLLLAQARTALAGPDLGDVEAHHARLRSGLSG